MNYIEQINGFWIKAETSDLSGLDIAVYMSLLKYCNRLNWLNPFVCHWDIVCQTSKVSKNAYYKSVDRLDFLGFIKYYKGVKNTNQKPKIFILELKNKEGIIKEQKGNKEGTEEEQEGNLYKHLNNKQINKILSYFNSLEISEIELEINKLIKYDSEDLPPTAFSFYKSLISLGAETKLANEWIDVRKKKKATNTETALEGFVREMNKGGLGINETLRICIEKSWSGLNAKWLSDIKIETKEIKGETPEEKDLRIRIEEFNKVKVH